ncbi:MAG: class I SAM-dependent methyltransferase [Hydrogenophilaceae bacterium]|nr:class I SAM-dependent methyltransferase [Hydrogenophilaceae bacterium]
MAADRPGAADDRTSFGFEDVPRAEKAQRVHGVFARVARRYDLMNDAMSGGLHRLWKDEAVAKLNPQPGEFFLDVAGGTGDIARRIARRAERIRKRRGGTPARIAIVDINEEMLAAGRARGEDGFSWVNADAEALPFRDASADGYTIAFGIRNCTNIDAVLREARRTLKPGGRFVCLEFSRLAIGGIEPVYDFYSFRIIPLIGKAVAGDEDSYRYLVESIRRFPEQEDFAGMMRDAGFARVGYRNLAGGVVALHWGWAL